jgi:hypothetical protein
MSAFSSGRLTTLVMHVCQRPTHTFLVNHTTVGACLMGTHRRSYGS